MKGCKLTEEELDAMAEAEEWVVDNLHNTEEDYIKAFKDGAEYGYNKALDEATHNYNAIIADYDKRIAELEKEKTDLVQEKNNLEYKIENLENKVEHHQEVIDTLQKKLERNCTSKGERINEN